MSLSKAFLDKQFENDRQFVKKDLKGDFAGIYGIEYKDGPKFGMSFHFKTRISDQGVPSQYGGYFLLMTEDEVKQFVDDKYVDAIKELNLDGLHYHSDNKDNLDLTIKMQFAEMFFACSFPSVTNTVLERLMQLSSESTNNTFKTSTFDNKQLLFFKTIDNLDVSKFNDGKLDYFKDTSIQTPKFITLSTWPTMRSYLQHLMSNDDDNDAKFYQHKLQDPPEFEYLTNYFNMMLYQDQLIRRDDAIQVPPRVTELDAVIKVLQPLLNKGFCI